MPRNCAGLDIKASPPTTGAHSSGGVSFNITIKQQAALHRFARPTRAQAYKTLHIRHKTSALTKTFKHDIVGSREITAAHYVPVFPQVLQEVRQ
jgi:hypothetical protein